MNKHPESFGKMRKEWNEESGSYTSIYLLEEIVGTTTLDEDNVPSRLVLINVFYLLVVWGFVGCCLIYRVMWNGPVAYATMGFPLLMLFILMIRSTSLPGADKGLSDYTGSWDWSVLKQRPDIWSRAVGQIFFSLGTSFGIISAFGSRCERKAPAYQSTMIVAASNWGISFLSGLCVFGALGCLTQAQGDFRVEAGSALLFTVFPAAMSTTPGGIHWVRFVFFNLVLLGVNSALGMVEAVVYVIEDSTFDRLTRKHVVIGVCSAGFISGLLYTTDVALHFIDTVDFYLNFVLLFLGFCKAFSAGWMYNIQKQIGLFGYSVIYVYLLSSFGSVILASLVWFGVAGNTFFVALLCFVAVYGAGLYYCYDILDRMENTADGLTLRVLCDEIIMGNILDLRVDLSDSVGYIPYAWAVLMKHVIPQILLVLFLNLSFSRTDHLQLDFGDYADYRVWPFQFIGVSIVAIMFGIVMVGLVNARFFDLFIEGAVSKQESPDDDFEIVEKDEEGGTTTTGYVEMSSSGGSGDLVDRQEGQSSPYQNMT